jgi:hypothetical protein
MYLIIIVHQYILFFNNFFMCFGNAFCFTNTVPVPVPALYQIVDLLNQSPINYTRILCDDT